MPVNTDTQRCFEKCVELCADSLYRVAFRLTGNQTLASELVQETYLNAWKNIASLKDPTRMRAWMFSILRNQYSKLVRSERRSLATAETLDQFAMPTANQDPDAIDTDQLQRGISELDDKHKLPLLLVSMEGMTVDQAAEVLQTPRGTVLSRLHRGREKLKQILVRNSHSLEQRGNA